MNKFSGWLLKELEARNMSQSDLARATGLTRQAISYYLGKKSKRPDDDALSQIARVFKIPAEQIYRAAGLLPPNAQTDEWVEEQSHKLALLPTNLRSIAGKMIDSMLQGEETDVKAKPKAKPAKA